MPKKYAKYKKMADVKKDHIYKSIFYACTAFLMFTLQTALSKLLSGQHGAIEIVFYRNWICLMPCIGFVIVRNQYKLLKTSMPFTMSFRVLIGMVGTILTLAAVQHLPLADATVLFFMSTLLIPVMAHFYLKERIGMPRWIAVAIGMTGVVIVAQPSGEVTLFGIALALGAATVHATIQVLIRAMKSEDPFTINFYFFFAGALVPAFFMPWIGSWPTEETLPILFGVALTGGLGQYFLTRGFQLAPASLLGPFNYTGLIWAVLLDILIWGYIPGWPVFLGSAIIIASKLFIIYRERQVQQESK